MPRKTAGKIIPRKSPSKDSNGGKLGQFTTEVKRTKDAARLEGKKSVGQLVLEAQEALREEGRQEMKYQNRILIEQLDCLKEKHAEEIVFERAKALCEGAVKLNQDSDARYENGVAKGLRVGREEGYEAGVTDKNREKFTAGLVIGMIVVFIAALIGIQFR